MDCASHRLSLACKHFYSNNMQHEYLDELIFLRENKALWDVVTVAQAMNANRDLE